MASEEGTGSKAYRRYVLLLLTLVYTFNFIDRQIMGILAPAIKADLELGDAQLGVLIGFAFAVFYTTLGIPVARIADRANRVTVVSIALAIWSGFTVVSGFAQSFLQLALARVGVGVGEAGGSPPSHSILSDLYPKEERAGALAVYALGIPIGVTMAYLGAGYVLTQFSWRTTFIIVGVPGLVLALLVKFTIREPERGRLDDASKADQFKSLEVGPPRGNVERAAQALSRLLPGRWSEVIYREMAILWRATKHLLGIPTYRGIVAGLTAGSFGTYAVAGWIVVFFRRSHPSLTLPEVLVSLGVITGTAYVLGVFVGGRLVDRLAARSLSAYGYVPAVALVLNLPFFLGSFWAQDPWVALALFWPSQLLVGFYLGPCFALAQTLAPVSVRALSTAIFFFILNLIALGLGPTLVGILSEALTESMGAERALRVALTTLVAAFSLSIVFFIRVARTVKEDWDAAS